MTSNAFYGYYTHRLSRHCSPCSRIVQSRTRAFGTHKPQTAEEWTSVLHLSSRWEFDDIRALAIREIERYPLNSVDKIVLSRQFDITSMWTLRAYTELCERSEPLTDHEALALGLQTTVRVSQLRERLCRLSGRRKFPPPHPSRRPAKRPESPFELSRPGVRKEFVLDPSARCKTPHSRGIPEKNPRLSDTSRLVAETFGLGIRGAV
jgi:hypothetical protein